MVTDTVKMEVLVLVQKQTVKTDRRYCSRDSKDRSAGVVAETLKMEVQFWM